MWSLADLCEFSASVRDWLTCGQYAEGMPNEQRVIPDELNQLSQRLEQWRTERPPHARLPEAIWEAAAEMARRYGLHQTTKLLRLDYTRLKKRMTGAAPVVSDRPNFLELLGPAAAVGPAECVVEWESARGRMRVAVKGGVPDWTSLLRAWRES
jgi:hypothetical protein